jgi:hypothetical protein
VEGAELELPTIGTLALEDDLRVKVPVTFPEEPPTGYRVRVEYALANGYWRLAGYAEADGDDVYTRPVPIGSVPEIRAMGECEDYRPTPPTATETIAAPETPALVRLRIELNQDTGDATLYWQANDFAAGLRLLWEIVPQADPENPLSQVDVDAALGTWDLPEKVPVGYRATVDVTAWESYPIGGDEGDKYRVSTERIALQLSTPATVEEQMRDALDSLVFDESLNLVLDNELITVRME